MKAHISLGNFAFILNRLVIIWFLLHLLTCVCIRQQDPASLVGRQLSGYISDTYFMMSTASTVGYGDVTVDHKRKTDVELTYLFGILIMILALVFFSYMQSTFNSLRSRWQAATSELEKESHLIEEWITLRNVRGYKPLTFQLEKQVKSLLHYMWQSNQASVLQSDWHRNLPWDTQYLLEKEIMNNVILKFQILRDLNDEALAISLLRQAAPER